MKIKARKYGTVLQKYIFLKIYFGDIIRFNEMNVLVNKYLFFKKSLLFMSTYEYNLYERCKKKTHTHAFNSAWK